jgi:hypothetical protein
MTPGDVLPGHPFLTARVCLAVAKARQNHRAHQITDADGPHRHHWQAILWVCRGCGEFEES